MKCNACRERNEKIYKLNREIREILDRPIACRCPPKSGYPSKPIPAELAQTGIMPPATAKGAQQ